MVGGAGAVVPSERAGAEAGMIVLAFLCASTARENEVTMKMTATTVVILPSTVGVPMEPKTAWLPLPPNAEPLSAPLPACSSTSPMMIKLTMTWMMTTKVNMPRSLLCWATLGGRLPGDGDEAWCLQGGAADERAVDVGLLDAGRCI